MPGQISRNPGYHQRRNDSTERASCRTEAVCSSPVTFFKPESYRHYLSGEYGRFRKSENTAADSKKDHIRGQASADTCRRPCDNPCKHHRFRAEPVYQNAGYGIHDGIAYKKYIDYPCVLQIPY